MKTLLALSVLLSSLHAFAAEKEHYDLKATATRNAEGQVLVDMKITTKAPDGITTVQASPKILIGDGKWAQIAIGTAAGVGSDPTEVDDGIRADAICVKGETKVVIVARVVKHQSVVWAAAQTIEATAAPAQPKKP